VGVGASDSKKGGEGGLMMKDVCLTHYFIQKEGFWRNLSDTETNCIVTYFVQKIRFCRCKSI
jgi:hypothetical protein